MAAFVLALAGLNTLYLSRRAHPPQPAQPARRTAAQGLPLAGHIICLDPGHGGYDGGARAKDSGVWEKGLNLAVALEARQALETLGAQVVMTRTEDIDLSSVKNGANTKKRRDMKERLAIAQRGEAQLLVSIHINEYRARSSSGPQVFYTKGQDASRLLAGCMQESLVKALTPAKERVAQAGNYYILGLPIPSVLVECGFISNPQEEKLLLTPAYQARVGQAIAQGILAFYTLQSPGDVIK